MTDFFFNCWCLDITLDKEYSTYQGASTIPEEFVTMFVGRYAVNDKESNVLPT
jgi:hypothetical protein